MVFGPPSSRSVGAHARGRTTTPVFTLSDRERPKCTKEDTQDDEEDRAAVGPILDRDARSSIAWQATRPALDRQRQRPLDLAAPRWRGGQRGWKVQPDGGLIGLGTSPATGPRWRPVISEVGGSRRAACGVGMLGPPEQAAPLGACSTSRPRYITPTPRGDMMDDREIVADEQVVSCRRRCRSIIRFRICACTETSSAEVGSSHTRNSGCEASARAIEMRWRWPPENSCGTSRRRPASARTRRSSSSTSGADRTCPSRDRRLGSARR